MGEAYGDAFQERQMCTKYWSENQKERPFKDICVNARIILEWILIKCDGIMQTGFV